MKVKEILGLNDEILYNILLEQDFKKMDRLNITVNDLVDLLKESARTSGQELNEEHITIPAYLDYLIEIEEGYKEYKEESEDNEL